MANILLVAVSMVFLVLVPNLSWGCSSNSGRTPAWDINDDTEIYPTYDPNTGSVGVGVTHRFRREAAHVPPTKRSLFTHLDTNNDGQIELGEWVDAKGSVDNFTDFLQDDDKNGDGQISWTEFKQITGVHFNHS